MGIALKKIYGPGPRMQRVENHTLDGDPSGNVNVRILLPHENPNAVIVYFHGGGWVTGSIDEFDTFGRKLAAATKAAVVLVNYRKAPEHPYPIAVNDAWTALTWTAARLAKIGGPDVPLVVAGDSAGGNLAAVLTQRARDTAGAPPIALQVLAYPVTDSNLNRASYADPENQLLVDRQSMVWFWDHYLKQANRRFHPEASPLRARSFQNLPPAIILTAEHDVLRDEGEAYVRRLTDAGVLVRHRRFDGQMHGFFTFVNILPGSDAGINYVAANLRELVC
ncbi:alpha/beta hydrolase [Rhodococcus sp. NM-2]|uniref:alpha/beta hydrolase n=1 Tax=Rhodococcus sp. NM-2 TaxID=3401174 RepID=UPI003AAF1B32